MVSRTLPHRLSSHRRLERMEDPITHFRTTYQTLSSIDFHQTPFFHQNKENIKAVSMALSECIDRVYNNYFDQPEETTTNIASNISRNTKHWNSIRHLQYASKYTHDSSTDRKSVV